MNRRILDEQFNKNKLDVLVSLAFQTRIWYAKFHSSDGYIFIEKDQATLFADGRYIESANKTAKNVDVKLYKSGALQEFVKDKNYKRVGIESDYITVDELDRLKKLLPKAKFINVSGQGLRILKTDKEAKLIKKAAMIGIKSFNQLQKEIKPGMTEKALASRLEYLFKVNGAQKESFDTIVASGPRAAMPHAQPTNKKIKNGELVKFDFGTIYQGYMSDTTRTIKIGEVKNPKLNEIWQIVKDAQQKGIEAVKPGITTGEIDKVCRDYIAQRGYGQYFVHSTGHGLGIDVHELPNVAPNSKQVLEVGHVITVEPGIYIEGLGGTRFEDDILVTKKGYKILSR